MSTENKVKEHAKEMKIVKNKNVKKSWKIFHLFFRLMSWIFPDEIVEFFAAKLLHKILFLVCCSTRIFVIFLQIFFLLYTFYGCLEIFLSMTFSAWFFWIFLSLLYKIDKDGWRLILAGADWRLTLFLGYLFNFCCWKASFCSENSFWSW